MASTFQSLKVVRAKESTQRFICRQQTCLEVFDKGTIILNATGANIFYQNAVIVELAMRDSCTLIGTHSLPHINHTLSYFNLFQAQSTRTRMLLQAVNLGMISQCVRHLSCDLRGGVVCPSSVFAKIFGATVWGVHICLVLFLSHVNQNR